MDWPFFFLVWGGLLICSVPVVYPPLAGNENIKISVQPVLKIHASRMRCRIQISRAWGMLRNITNGGRQRMATSGQQYSQKLCVSASHTIIDLDGMCVQYNTLARRTPPKPTGSVVFLWSSCWLATHDHNQKQLLGHDYNQKSAAGS